MSFQFTRGELIVNIIKIILAISVLTLSVFSLINRSLNSISIMAFLLGALLLTMGVEEIKKDKKTIGYLLIVAAVFNLLISFQGFFL